MQGRVLIIAGSDSGGGAGIQADIKTVTALGGYAATAITALTAQNTQGVFAIHPVAEPFIAQQIELVLNDIGADAIKIGMLHSASVITTVATVLAKYPSIPVILDPVMIAKGGAPLLAADAISTLSDLLVPRAALITPNIPEAALLAHVNEDIGMQTMAEFILTQGARAVLIKGGHSDGVVVTDLLLTLDTMETYSHPRLHTRNTHGTGCTLSSAIAVGIAQGMSLHAAIVRAREYVLEAMKSAPNLGQGHGPLNHGHTFTA